MTDHARVAMALIYGVQRDGTRGRNILTALDHFALTEIAKRVHAGTELDGVRLREIVLNTIGPYRTDETVEKLVEMMRQNPSVRQLMPIIRMTRDRANCELSDKTAPSVVKPDSMENEMYEAIFSGGSDESKSSS